jgi:hypothetical protein
MQGMLFELTVAAWQYRGGAGERVCIKVSIPSERDRIFSHDKDGRHGFELTDGQQSDCKVEEVLVSEWFRVVKMERTKKMIIQG